MADAVEFMNTVIRHEIMKQYKTRNSKWLKMQWHCF